MISFSFNDTVLDLIVRGHEADFRQNEKWELLLLVHSFHFRENKLWYVKLNSQTNNKKQHILKLRT